MKAPRTVPIRIPIEIECTEDPRVVHGSKDTGIYLFLRKEAMCVGLGGAYGDNLIIQRSDIYELDLGH